MLYTMCPQYHFQIATCKCTYTTLGNDNIACLWRYACLSLHKIIHIKLCKPFLKGRKAFVIHTHFGGPISETYHHIYNKYFLGTGVGYCFGNTANKSRGSIGKHRKYSGLHIHYKKCCIVSVLFHFCFCFKVYLINYVCLFIKEF